MGEYRRENTRSSGPRRGGFNRGGDRGNRGGSFNRGGSRGGFGGRDRGPVEETEVICDKCGKETTVPFKPTGNKPVLCRDCFKKDGGTSGRDSGRDSRGPRNQPSSGV